MYDQNLPPATFIGADNRARINIGAPTIIGEVGKNTAKKNYKSKVGSAKRNQMAPRRVGGKVGRGKVSKRGKRSKKRGGKKRTNARGTKAFTVAKKGRVRITLKSGKTRVLSAAAILKHVPPASLIKAARSVRTKRR